MSNQNNKQSQFHGKSFEFQVDTLISRDLDSRFTNREKDAVDDWLKSDKDIHLMRDHPGHRFGRFLAGMFGTKLTNDTIRQKWKKSFAKGFEDKILFADRSLYSPDQHFLNT